MKTSWRRAAVFWLTVVAWGCRDAGRELAESRESLVSWAATARFAASGFSRGDLSATFTREAVKAAARSIEQEGRRLARLSQKTRSPEAGALADASRGLMAQLEGLAAAVARDSRAEAHTQEEAFARWERLLRGAAP